MFEEWFELQNAIAFLVQHFLRNLFLINVAVTFSIQLAVPRLYCSPVELVPCSFIDYWSSKKPSAAGMKAYKP